MGDPCVFCGEPTNSLAGNPGEWPLWFCEADGSGFARVHHVSCVQDRLSELKGLDEGDPIRTVLVDRISCPHCGREEELE